MKLRNELMKKRLLAGGIASTIAATSLLFLPSAAWADISGSYTSDVSTVAQGGTVTFTLSRSYYGFNTTDGDITYFCDEQQAGDTSDDSQPGYSIVLMLMDQNNNVITTPNTLVSGTSALDYLFDGPGVGNITPNDYPYTGQLAFPFTVPSSVPAGNYGAVLGCISPAYRSVTADNTEWSSPIIPLTVTGSSADTAAEKLPVTGSSSVITSGALIASVVLVLTGSLALVVRRRKKLAADS
jgi:LPXTG-motif cell wall-anchored protein